MALINVLFYYVSFPVSMTHAVYLISVSLMRHRFAFAFP